MPKYEAEPIKMPETQTVVKTVVATEHAMAYLGTLKGTYKTTTSLNVRNGAGVTKKRLVTIPKGTKVKNYGYYTNHLGTKWLYVQFTFDGVKYTGFASGKYLEK